MVAFWHWIVDLDQFSRDTAQQWVQFQFCGWPCGNLALGGTEHVKNQQQEYLAGAARWSHQHGPGPESPSKGRAGEGTDLVTESILLTLTLTLAAARNREAAGRIPEQHEHRWFGEPARAVERFDLDGRQGAG